MRAMGSAPPQYSPDGHWWWDGQQWIPALEYQARIRAHQARWSTINWLLFGLGVAAVGFFVLLIAGSFISQP
jgi:hypothetical protein